MKKMFAAVILLLVLALGSVCYAFASVNQAKDQVVLTPNHMAGDVSAAEGLEILLRNQYDERLHWDTVYHPGTKASAETEFTHTVNAVRDGSPAYSRIELNTGFLLGYSNGSNGWNPLAPAYEEMLEDAPVGEVVTRIIRVKDYCEYYSLSGMIDFPAFSIYWDESEYNGWLPADDPGADIPGTNAYVADKFQEFFRIPVRDDEYLELHIQKDSKDSIYMSGGGSGAGGGHYSMWSDSVFASDAVYFTFNSLYSDRTPVDTSLIPGGYGIYRLPFADEEPTLQTEFADNATHLLRVSGVNADELEMVYPLDPSIDFRDMALTPDQSQILLHSYEDGKYVMTVIDAATMKTLQRLELEGPEAENADFFLYEGDGFYVSVLDSRQLLLFTEDETGAWQLEMESSLEREEDVMFWLYDTSYLSMDYDGDKLAIAFLMDEEPSRTAFHLAVFEKAGLAYYGQYGSSLGTMPVDMGEKYRYYSYEYLCRPADIYAIQAVWK